MPLVYGRHTSISADPKVAAEQNGENARDFNQALLRCVLGYYEVVRNYAAQGDTTKTIPLPDRYGRRPVAVQCVGCVATYDPGTNVAATPSLNFVYEAGSIKVFEPSGLVLNTMYDLTFLILE